MSTKPAKTSTDLIAEIELSLEQASANLAELRVQIESRQKLADAQLMKLHQDVLKNSLN